MNVNNSTDFEIFEKQFTDLIGEFHLLTISESRLREAHRIEATRAEAAEAARDEADKVAADLRASTAAATAGANQASKVLSAVQDDLTNAKIQLDLAERQRSLFEEKCTEMSEHIVVLEKELQEFKPLQSLYAALQRQYLELQERIQLSTENARREANRLENELRRVEKCASAGSELRERARLAAAAHARDRRFAAAELQDTARELQIANGEVMRLNVLVSELQCKLCDIQENTTKDLDSTDQDILTDTKAALEAERSTTTRLERALAAALADNATLAAQLHRIDNNSTDPLPEILATEETTSTNICPIDSFLAE